MSFDAAYLEAAHEHCFGNELEVRASDRVCCISCARSFGAGLATEVVGQRGSDDLTVFCPVCTFDSILGDRSGYPVEDAAFVAAMNATYFTEPHGSEEAWKELLRAQNR